MKTRILMLGLVLSIMTIGCTKKDATDSTVISPDEATINAKIDAVNEDVSRIIEEQFDATQANPLGRGIEAAPPSCPTISRTPAFTQTLLVGDNVTKVIDFGSNCLRNGNTLSGVIQISFVYDPSATSHTVTYTFIDFYHNAKKFAGTKTFVISKISTPVNTALHRVVVMNMNMTMTLPDGRTFTRVGTRTRELISGSVATATAIWQVVGNWTTTFPNNSVQTSTITTPLTIKTTCIASGDSPIVSGIISFVRNGNTATLNYGAGLCDRLAVFTYNGIAHNIILGN